MRASETLNGLQGALAKGWVKVVDLTETLTPEYPVITLPPEFGQGSPFVKQH